MVYNREDQHQTASVQSNPETYLDLWCTTVGITIKLLVYKAILKPIWDYDVQLWGSASNC